MLMENLSRSKEFLEILENGARRAPKQARLKDLRAKNYLFQAIHKNILKIIAHKSTAKLKIKFQDNDRVKRAQLNVLKREFEILEMKVGESVTNYFGRVVNVVNNMRSL